MRKTKIQFLRDALAAAQRTTNESLDPTCDIPQSEIEAGCPKMNDATLYNFADNLCYEYRVTLESNEEMAQDEEMEELCEARDKAKPIAHACGW